MHREQREIKLSQIKEKPFLTTEELSLYIGRSPGAVRNLVMRRAIPFRKLGGRLIFLKREIDQWVEMAEGATLDEVLTK